MSAPQSGPESPQVSQLYSRGSREQSRTSGGALGARPQLTRTFDGHDPATVAALHHQRHQPDHGARHAPGCTGTGGWSSRASRVADISDHLADRAVTIWLDLRDPDRDDLAVLSEEFGLAPAGRRGRAVHEHERPKLDRYRSHLFLTAYAAQLDTGTGQLGHQRDSAPSSPSRR